MTKWMSINGKRVVFEEGETVLEVATKAGIYIPTLCARPDLPSLGACRLCIIDVEGSRVYPNSCTLPARENMVVRTATPDLQAVRRNIFQLILAEHPSYCLVCKEQNECSKLRHGEYKAGRVIGCYTCSHKELCEIRKISEYLRVKEIRFPILYKNLPLERDDPFLVRDYNLCILCARCIRACQDVLGYSAIALTKRGHDTKVGTILDVPHLESGCVFCGHCIDVCPTGALTARGSTWFGAPDKTITTTCVLCSHGCQMVVDVKWGKVVNVHPPYDMSARREYCVKGRFCIPALLNGRDRLKYPTIKRKILKEEHFPVSWDEAIAHIAENFKNFNSDKIGFLLSPFLTDEAIFLFNKLAKEINSNNVAYNDEDLCNLASRGIKALITTYNSKIIHEIDSLEFLVVQDIYHHTNYEAANVIVPTTAFTEEEGTKTGDEYIKYQIQKAVDPPGLSLPSWIIVSRLGQAMGLKDFSYESINELQDEIMRNEPLNVPLVSKQSLEYMGIPIAEKVEEFDLFLNAKRVISESKGKGMQDVRI
ncbi:MAG: molybdopterin-dependent oxidoreductase [Candidatus Hodarchaeota archaeon]